jgi:peroxiredoxin
MFIDVMLVLILISLWVGLYQVVKQQGRILLRLDQLEAPRPADSPDPAPSGLPVGTAFPNFRLPDLSGRFMRFEEFHPKQVLLVHWSPGCGFCEMIARDLAGLEHNLLKQGVQLLLLAHGDAATNRKLAEEHGLSSPILLLDGNAPCEPLRNMGTPVAYLLDHEGRIARPCAVGFEEVMALARSVAAQDSSTPDPRALPGAQPLTESSILRDGLKAGTPAPLFRLPSIQGNSVSLADYRGRQVLLVFSDPQCGPCDALMPELVRFEREHRDDGLKLILVGRGDRAENRRKAEQFGIHFPVVLQEKWKLSKEYGIFATPVAFLIGEDGLLLQNVAVGAEAITALALEGLKQGKDYQSALSV